MPPINPMKTGQTQRVHLKAYGEDPNNTISQVADTTSTLVVRLGPGSTGIITVEIDPNDNRALIVTAIAAGPASIFVDEATPLPSALELDVDVTAPPPPDNRRIDLIAADPPQG